jgi:hypothetical protein
MSRFETRVREDHIRANKCEPRLKVLSLIIGCLVRLSLPILVPAVVPIGHSPEWMPGR